MNWLGKRLGGVGESFESIFQLISVGICLKSKYYCLRIIVKVIFNLSTSKNLGLKTHEIVELQVGIIFTNN